MPNTNTEATFEKLATALRAAEDAHAATIGTTDAAMLPAYRELLVAKLAYFRAYGDEDMVYCIEGDISDLDREIRSLKVAA